MDGSKLWDLFLVVFGVVLGKAIDAASEQTKKAPKAGKHFKEP